MSYNISPDPANVMMSQVAQLSGCDGKPLLPGQFVQVATSPQVVRLLTTSSTQEMPQKYIVQPPSSPGDLSSFSSVILILHKLTGLEMLNRNLITEKRLYCFIALGQCHLRTSMILPSTPEATSLDLNFIIRIPLSPPPDTTLFINIQDSTTNSPVAHTKIDLNSAVKSGDQMAVKEIEMIPKGFLRYHLKFLVQPTGSASVQKMGGKLSGPEDGLMEMECVRSSGDQFRSTIGAMESVETNAVGGLTEFGGRYISAAGAVAPPATPPTPPPPSAPSGSLGQSVLAHHQYPAMSTISSLGYHPSGYNSARARTPPMGEAAVYKSSIGKPDMLTQESLPRPTVFATHRGIVPEHYRTATTVMSGGGSMVSSSAFGFHSRVPTYDGRLVGATAMSPTVTSHLGGGLASGGTVLQMGGMMTSLHSQHSHHSRSASEGFGPQVVSRRTTQSSSRLSTNRHSQSSVAYYKNEDGSLRAIQGLRSSPLGASVLERMNKTPASIPSKSTTENTPPFSLATFPRDLVKCPPIPSNCQDLTPILSRLSNLQKSDQGLTLFHPFQSISLRLESLDHILTNDTTCLLQMADAILRPQIVRISFQPQTLNLDHPTLLFPINLTRPNARLKISIMRNSVEVSSLELPLQGLLRHGKVEVCGSAEMSGMETHILRLSLRFLALPVSTPSLMEPRTRYKLSLTVIKSPRLDGALGPESLGNSEQAAAVARSESIASLSTLDDAEPIDRVGSNLSMHWNHLTVTINEIDDSIHPIPLELRQESTKDLFCKVSLGTTTALRAKLINWRCPTRKLPAFEFEHKGERVLKISLIGTTPNSKVNFGVCRIDLHALSRTGRSFFRGRVPLSGNSDIPEAPFLNLTFKFSLEDLPPQQTVLPHPAASWRQALSSATHFIFKVLSITASDVSALRTSFCVRLSSGKIRYKTPRLEILPTQNQFSTETTLECEVTDELIDILEIKPFVLCIYVRIPSGENTNSHAAYQYFRLAPSHFMLPSDLPREYTGTAEMTRAPDVDIHVPQLSMNYSMHIIKRPQASNI